MYNEKLYHALFSHKRFWHVFIILGSYVIFYSHTIYKMALNWMRDGNYSHGFLIPLICAYMIWAKRDRLYRLDYEPTPWGLVVIILAMAMHIIGTLSAEMFILRSSLIICIIGIIVLFFGFRVFSAIYIPIIYLFFMIPIPKIIWNQISFPMQLMASKTAADIMHLFNIPIFRQGNILYLSNMTLEIVDACSGLRSLTTLLAISCAISFIAKLKVYKKWLIFLSAVPIAIIVNIFRLTITAVLAEFYGTKIAEGFLHDFSGIITFMLAFYLLYALHTRLSKLDTKCIK